MKGRATRGAFVALKARALSILQARWTNPPTLKEHWEDAAKAGTSCGNCRECIIFTATPSMPTVALLLDKWNANTEIIFERRFQFPEITHNIYKQ